MSGDQAGIFLVAHPALCCNPGRGGFDTPGSFVQGSTSNLGPQRPSGGLRSSFLFGGSGRCARADPRTSAMPRRRTTTCIDPMCGPCSRLAHLPQSVNCTSCAVKEGDATDFGAVPWDALGGLETGAVYPLTLDPSLHTPYWRTTRLQPPGGIPLACGPLGCFTRPPVALAVRPLLLAEALLTVPDA